MDKEDTEGKEKGSCARSVDGMWSRKVRPGPEEVAKKG